MSLTVLFKLFSFLIILSLFDYSFMSGIANRSKSSKKVMLVPSKKLGWKCPNYLKNGTHATTTAAATAAAAATTASGWHRRPDIEYVLRARGRHQQPGRSHDQVFAVITVRHDAALHLRVRPERVRDEYDNERPEIGRIVEGLHRYVCRPVWRRQSSNRKST